MKETNFIFKVTLPSNWSKPLSRSLVGRNESRSDCNLTVLTGLDVDSDVFHDGNVELVKDADDQAFAAGCTDRIVKSFHVNQQL